MKFKTGMLFRVLPLFYIIINSFSYTVVIKNFEHYYLNCYLNSLNCRFRILIYGRQKTFNFV